MNQPAENHDIAALIAQGIAATKAQRKQDAIQIFYQVLRRDRGNIEAWLWVARLTDDPAGRRKCLNVVQKLDPQNLEARFMLKELDHPIPPAAGPQTDPAAAPGPINAQTQPVLIRPDQARPHANPPHPPLAPPLTPPPAGTPKADPAPARFNPVQSNPGRNNPTPGHPGQGSSIHNRPTPVNDPGGLAGRRPNRRWIPVAGGVVLLVALLVIIILWRVDWGQNPPDSNSETTAEPDTSNLYVEYILDASGSMVEPLPTGELKSVAAVTLLSSHLKTYRPETNLGLRVYGHRVAYQEDVAASCQDIELIAPVQPGYLGAIVNWLSGYQPQGMSPIASALQQAMADFTPGDDRVNSIVLISDGMETCGGDPCATVNELKDLGLRFTVYVIGLNVDSQAREQLSCVASSGGGTYQDVKSTQELQSALDQVQQDLIQEAGGGVEPEAQPEPPLFEGEIAYIGPDGNVYILNGTSLVPEQITFDAGGGYIYWMPRWSPDRMSLYFLGGRADPDDYISEKSGNLFQVPPGSNTPQTMLSDVYSYDFFPGGGEIAFLSKQFSYQTPRPAIGILNLATGAVSTITPALDTIQETIISIDVSPDGNKIFAAHSDRAGSGIGSMTSILSTVDNAPPITTTYLFSTDWTPDGSQLACVPQMWGGTLSIELSTPGESSRTIFTDTSGEGIGEMLWSPDGSRIVFSTGYGLEPRALMQINRDGTSLQAVGTGTPVAWSPDSRQLLVHAENQYQIIDPSTGKILFQFSGGNDRDASWIKRNLGWIGD
ncbi:MAG TPA: VWA domain-containing protein [Anaerolineaceae bacterium]|nr:VWA domain-containing protein [Anaerolineaceae bacterium]